MNRPLAVILTLAAFTVTGCAGSQIHTWVADEIDADMQYISEAPASVAGHISDELAYTGDYAHEAPHVVGRAVQGELDAAHELFIGPVD